MRINLSLVVLALVIAMPACAESDMSPVKVEIVKTQTGFELYRGGEPYLVKGAGLEFRGVDDLVAHGGNSIRTWTTENDVETAQEVLDKAHAAGVTVALCLPMMAERWGFDYDDEAAVAAQLAEFREEVLKYKDHPALLVWIIGNELNLESTNPRVYDAVNDVSRMIHELDPNHPTTTTTAGLFADVVERIETRAPDLDFISFQAYGQLAELPDFIKRMKYDKPFMVTEWGAIGFWEVHKTPWGAPVEQTSTEKARNYKQGFEKRIKPVSDLVIGNYVFLWGQKQERTPTWFGLFTEAGEETEAIDVMHYLWNDEWPENRAPQVRGIHLNAQTAYQGVRLKPGKTYSARARVSDPDKDPLTFHWEVKPETRTTQVGGDFEHAIENIEGVVMDPASEKTKIVAPDQPGAYRLFFYAYDGQGNAAHANIPFYVSP